MSFFTKTLLLVVLANIFLNVSIATAKENEHLRIQIVELATSYLGKGYKYSEPIKVIHPRSGEERVFRFDCSGFVSAVYWSSDIDYFEKYTNNPQMSTAGIHTHIKKSNKIYKSKPQKGDFIFFSRTTKKNIPLSHIGLVVDTDSKGVTSFVHMSNSGIKIGYINLSKPNEYRVGNVVFNSYVRGNVGARGLASKCFESYGTVFNKPK